MFSQHYILNDDGTRASVDETQLQPDSTTITSHTAWTYDAMSRLTGEVLTTSATNQSYSDVFAYDLASNRASLGHEVKIAGFTANYTASTLTFAEPKASIVVGTKLRLSVSRGNLSWFSLNLSQIPGSRRARRPGQRIVPLVKPQPPPQPSPGVPGEGEERRPSAGVSGEGKRGGEGVRPGRGDRNIRQRLCRP